VLPLVRAYGRRREETEQDSKHTKKSSSRQKIMKKRAKTQKFLKKVTHSLRVPHYFITDIIQYKRVIKDFE
jgi:hypothetical protein